MVKKQKAGSIKVTYGQVVGIMGSLAYLSRMNLPVLAAMWVRGAVRVFLPIMEDVDKQRRALQEKHAVKMNDGSIKVDEHDQVVFEDEEAHQAELDTLFEGTADIICKPLLIEMLEPRNPANEVLIVPAAIAALEEVGLIAQQKSE